MDQSQQKQYRGKISNRLYDNDGSKRTQYNKLNHKRERYPENQRQNKESDHNTILMAIKINNPRKREYTTKWKLEDKDGWNQFNKN